MLNFQLRITIPVNYGQSIEIFELGQIYSSSKSIRISGVVEHCCISINYCIPVHLLGGVFGEWKAHKNRLIIILWPGISWKYINEDPFCQISLLIKS
ncbi:unnamed protein product [Adineta steineri]|uniref:Uncharacterized protein n=1 Tax=Adineta steineri TaxID=433720 RepID=A0A819CAU6_9BILA|nr:unnamed protein product [Adineta steineri]